ncbi:MAG: hypothetical protein LQ343_001812 [Gyalolechia ehrenbergii]|nr:MAG: hypothetical protein LQ343_001812 [Gyalolechia ehrenbergii]
MAPGGDWLARKLLGNDLVQEVDRRNDAARRAFKAAGKKSQYGQPAPSSSHYSESPHESKVRRGNDPQAYQYGGGFPVPSRGHATRHQEVRMRGGDAPQPSQYGGDSPSPSRHTEGRASQRHSCRPLQVPSNGRDDIRPSRAADGGHSQNLLVNPYGVSHGAADSNRSVNYAPQQSSHAAAGSRHRTGSGRSRQAHAQGGEEDFYKGHRIVEVTPRSSRHSAVPDARSRQEEGVHPRSSRHSAVPSARSRQSEGVQPSGNARHGDGFDPRDHSRAGDFYTRQL